MTHARKRFGQHFLVDPAVIARIVREIDPRAGDALVEIGPGRGALTAPLLDHAGALTVIEIDRDLAARLRTTPGLDVVEADALGVDFVALAAARRPAQLRIVGNLPYNISTPILFGLLDAAAVVRDQHVMLQKEVVDRMAAAPASKDYGRLTVMLQWRYAIEPLFDVAPDAFDPPPRVDSTVVRMVPRPAPVEIDPALLRELVTVAFSQRRKLLRHTLGRWLESRRAPASFDVQRRAEEVPVSEYLALAAALAQDKSTPEGSAPPSAREASAAGPEQP
ncbi:MAG: 16S rRNA (adenine(1518)-N(6)/adenine(1519)-N(6))-dimethyltransferase RsmA [Rhizobacter sp.]|nr:16S rRNA (adenine(1518)-N(6)/adenine(1519)-N(6))-dimethyltransferase RsmA [Rhizobacter sp.]